MTIHGETHVQILERENDELRAKLAAAESRIYDLRQLLETACDAWESGMAVSRDGIVLADYMAACLPRAWYDAAKKAIGGE